MAQSQIQTQKQEQSLRQTLSQQQLLQVHLVELPIAQLAERINTEMNDNPALEAESPDYNETDDWQDKATQDNDNDDFEVINEQEERQSALDDALKNIGRDDEELPVYHSGNNSSEEREEMIYGNSISFYDQLKEQVSEIVLTPKQQEIIEYFIGSLDDDGLLRKSLDAINDELAIYHNIDTTKSELEEVLHMLQQFDPAGIGARNLQECLLLQIDRREDNIATQLMRKVIVQYFDDFTKKRWNHIARQMNMSETQAQYISNELRKLNPKPGASMGEVIGRNMQQITPDFIIDTLDDGTVTFALNNADIPQLQVSQSFADTLNEYKTNGDNLSKQMKEALLYTKNKVEAAQGFIEAVKQRRHTLTITMQAIINWQHRFFEDGDEASLRPMILKDIADKTGLDISTISRVSNAKYAQTHWGTFPLRFFFTDGYVTQDGEELSTRKIRLAIKEIIDSEDKHHPLNDDALKTALAEKGYPIARRTVAKYREQLGLPIARLRKI